MSNYSTLSFVKAPESDEGNMQFWHVSPSSDYASDCATGRAMAGEVVAFLHGNDALPLLGWIVQAVGTLEREWGGIEAGFFHALATELR